MAFLKQVATKDTGGAEPFATGRLIPATEPTGTAYVAWKAKNYSTTLRNSANGTVTGYKWNYGFGQLIKYHKILKRESKTNATRMAA